MSDYRVSYLVTTYNKLPYLKQVMERLVAARQDGEEIVVADGAAPTAPRSTCGACSKPATSSSLFRSATRASPTASTSACSWRGAKC